MTVAEYIQKHFPDVKIEGFDDWRVFGPQSLDDAETTVLFYDRASRPVREFEIGIDGSIKEINLKRRIKAGSQG